MTTFLFASASATSLAAIAIVADDAITAGQPVAELAALAFAHHLVTIGAEFFVNLVLLSFETE